MITMFYKNGLYMRRRMWNDDRGNLCAFKHSITRRDTDGGVKINALHQTIYMDSMENLTYFKHFSS
jgi:hypothetical protein